MTSYFLYKSDVAASVKKEFPEASAGEVQQIITDRWLSIDNRIRAAYMQKYEENRQRYLQEKQEYEAIYGKEKKKYRKRRLRRNQTE